MIRQWQRNYSALIFQEKALYKNKLLLLLLAIVAHLVVGTILHVLFKVGQTSSYAITVLVAMVVIKHKHVVKTTSHVCATMVTCHEMSS